MTTPYSRCLHGFGGTSHRGVADLAPQRDLAFRLPVPASPQSYLGPRSERIPSPAKEPVASHTAGHCLVRLCYGRARLAPFSLKKSAVSRCWSICTSADVSIAPTCLSWVIGALAVPQCGWRNRCSQPGEGPVPETV